MLWLKKRRMKRRIELMRMQDEERAFIASRPCVASYTFATSRGGVVECGTHGGPLSCCRLDKED